MKRARAAKLLFAGVTSIGTFTTVGAASAASAAPICPPDSTAPICNRGEAPEPTAPRAPTVLRLEAYYWSGGQGASLVVAFKDNSSNESGFRVYISKNGAPRVLTQTLGRNNAFGSGGSIDLSNAQYCAWVSAFNAQGEVFSQPLCGSMPLPASIG